MNPLTGRINFQCVALRFAQQDDGPQLRDSSDLAVPRIGVKPLEANFQQVRPNTEPGTPASKTYVSDPPIFGDMSLKDFSARQRTSAFSTSPAKPLKLKQTQPVDLNGIPPLKPFLFSAVALCMCLLSWQAAVFLAQHFAVQLLNSDIYPLQRASVVSRNLLVGITTLAAGFSGVVGVGLLGLGAQVAWGVSRGELDPNRTSETTESLNK